MMLGYTIRYEKKRIFDNLRNLFIFGFFLSLSLYFVNLGVEKYENYLEEIENFVAYEKQKTANYLNYEQYGAYGFRVLFKPAPLAIFCSSSLLFLEGRIDTKEIVDISINHKGKSVFYNYKSYGDFSSMFFVFGSLMMLYFGLITFTSPASMMPLGDYPGGQYKRSTYMKCISVTLLARLLLLNGYFTGVFAAAFALAAAQGIHFSGAAIAAYLLFYISTVLFLAFFYVLGVLGALLLSYRKSLYTLVFAAWFGLLFMLPGICRLELENKAHLLKSNEKVNSKKLANLMLFERRYREAMQNLKEEKVKNLQKYFAGFLDDYMKNEYALNKEIEEDLNRDVGRLIDYNERESVLLPSSLLLYLAGEFSSYGYYNYQDFLAFMLNLKESFARYFFDKRYNRIGEKVVPFLKAYENIFEADCTLPKNLSRGLLLTSFYIACLWAAVFFIAAFQGAAAGDAGDAAPSQKGSEMGLDIQKMEKGKTYFSFCRGKKEMEKILDYLHGQGASIISKLDPEKLDTAVPLKTWMEYECCRCQLSPGTAGDLYKKLNEEGVMRGKIDSRIKNLGPEILNRAYLEIKLALVGPLQVPIYVFADFLKGVSRDFEKEFKTRLKLVTPGAIILYISGEMFEVAVPGRDGEGAEDARFFIVDFDNVSLR